MFALSHQISENGTGDTGRLFIQPAGDMRREEEENADADCLPDHRRGCVGELRSLSEGKARNTGTGDRSENEKGTDPDWSRTQPFLWKGVLALWAIRFQRKRRDSPITRARST